MVTAAAYPAQAILMSRFIDVFQLTGSAMEDKGSFFALMFFAMACGTFVVYFLLGWVSNVIAAVRYCVMWLLCHFIADYVLGLEPQVPQAIH